MRIDVALIGRSEPGDRGIERVKASESGEGTSVGLEARVSDGQTAVALAFRDGMPATVFAVGKSSSQLDSPPSSHPHQIVSFDLDSMTALLYRDLEEGGIHPKNPNANRRRSSDPTLRLSTAAPPAPVMRDLFSIALRLRNGSVC